jgi:signal transduction histidine kinase
LIKDEAGQPAGFVALTRDITHRKQAEAERETLIQELEKKNNELESFTYTVSHDLKAPLVTITGFLGYLAQDAENCDSDKIQKDIQHINQAVTKMHRLLNELLELSRIGRLVNSPEKVSFYDIVQDALKQVGGHLADKKIDVQVEVNLPVVYGDRIRLVEVLQNLIDNAAKFMGDQTNPRIEIGQSGEDAEHGKTIFHVKDNGIGIDSAYHERIFGLFNKLDPRAEGTGIGLAIVKRIVEVHGGRIWVESEGHGKGSTFYFTLPLSSTRQENN